MAMKILRYTQNDTVPVLKHKLKLSPRLQTVADYIEQGAAVADVGTDHGMLPAYLALNKLARNIIATDLSANSLKTALKNAGKYGVTDMIKFVVADGLDGVSEDEADTVVIAGVGGETIIKIIEAAPWTKKPGKKLILQPQTKVDKLCLWLRENGYAIRDTVLTHDKGRAYTVIIVNWNPSKR